MKNMIPAAFLFLIVFWNAENLFDDRPGFNAKCNGIAKTLMMMADECGEMPDAIALAEVKDRATMSKLVYRTPLRKFDYGIVHYDSPDKRGIDCALLYRKSSFRLLGSKPCHICDSSGATLRTRDILLVEMLSSGGNDTLAVLVNHHPSKLGDGSSARRGIAMDRMNSLCDSLEKRGIRNILCVGDFNDDVWPGTQPESLSGKATGTIKYNGHWEKIDGCFARGLTVRETIYDAPHLLTDDSRFGGMKPFRAYSGPRYSGGISDHLPIILSVSSHSHSSEGCEK